MSTRIRPCKEILIRCRNKMKCLDGLDSPIPTYLSILCTNFAHCHAPTKSTRRNPRPPGLPPRRRRRSQALHVASPSHARRRSVLQAPLLRHLQPPLCPDDPNLAVQPPLPPLLEAHRPPPAGKRANGASGAAGGHLGRPGEVSIRLRRGQDHRPGPPGRGS
jgi:hypothetical protein